MRLDLITCAIGRYATRQRVLSLTRFLNRFRRPRLEGRKPAKTTKTIRFLDLASVGVNPLINVVLFICGTRSAVLLSSRFILGKPRNPERKPWRRFWGTFVLRGSHWDNAALGFTGRLYMDRTKRKERRKDGPRKRLKMKTQDKKLRELGSERRKKIAARTARLLAKEMTRRALQRALNYRGATNGPSVVGDFDPGFTNSESANIVL